MALAPAGWGCSAQSSSISRSVVTRAANVPQPGRPRQGGVAAMLPRGNRGRTRSRGTPRRSEAHMNEVVPSQHPAVVLRSHYEHLRALLLVTMLAVIGLTVAVVILATRDNGSSATPAAAPAAVAAPAASSAAASPTTRFDGGPEEGTRGASVTSSPTTRFDGGPEEGTRGALAAPSSEQQGPSVYYGGHEEGSAGH